jgi:hypothetical protein
MEILWISWILLPLWSSRGKFYISTEFALMLMRFHSNDAEGGHGPAKRRIPLPLLTDVFCLKAK